MSTIQWFPGHMAKARRQVEEQLSRVDIVIELVDARVPESSRNPLIQEITANKPRILVLNKADLADAKTTRAWIDTYRHQNQKAIAIDAKQNKGINALKKLLKEEMQPYFDNQAKKGIKPRAIRLLIVGIPNVGKSTLINRFVGKNQAQTGNKPGVTRQQQWLRVDKSFDLLDTPGILWPKFEDPDVGKKLAITGAIKDTLLHMDDLALYLLDFLRATAPDILQKRYRLTASELSDLSTVDLLLTITERMGLNDNYDQASERLILSYRNGDFGALTLDPVEVSAYEA